MLCKCCKVIGTRGQKNLGGNSYICRSCRGKTGGGLFLLPLPPMLDRLKVVYSFEKKITAHCKGLLAFLWSLNITSPIDRSIWFYYSCFIFKPWKLCSIFAFDWCKNHLLTTTSTTSFTRFYRYLLHLSATVSTCLCPLRKAANNFQARFL